MNLFQRIGYFSMGLIMGIGILMFFLGGKKTSCDYSPNARVLKNIRIKERHFSPDALQFFTFNKIDTSTVSTILKDGDVDFGESDTRSNKCKTYYISGNTPSGEIELEIENCKEKATVQKVKFMD
ncbi:hypothetical protein L1I30_07415 [Gillisia sp. M10.2A]|uniref:DUF4258 domain-containing protein n=1 Tax=Gillisia lutea TaxID=2909668 RepID=A0ABS9EFB6_9FLAO|nr:hypothetical protein [Gillisia lutea]MCF4101488.1 hypothetical protein [Gillisia lutea]